MNYLSHKHYTPFTCKAENGLTARMIEDALATKKHSPILPHADQAVGFTPIPEDNANPEHLPMTVTIDDCVYFIYRIQARKIKPSEVKELAQAEMQQSQAASPGKEFSEEEEREIELRIYRQLLETTKPVTINIPGFIQLSTGLMCLSATSIKNTTLTCNALRSVMGDIEIKPLISTTLSYFLTEWLAKSEKCPREVTFENKCKLMDAHNSMASFQKHNLHCAEVLNLIEQGMLIQEVAITWKDHMNFVLYENGQIRQIVFNDGYFDKQMDDLMTNASTYDETVRAHAEVTTDSICQFFNWLAEIAIANEANTEEETLAHAS